VSLAEDVDGGWARATRARPHGSPVAVTRSGLDSLVPPIPQRGLGRRTVESMAARESNPPLERRPRLAVMARTGGPGPAAVNVFRETHQSVFRESHQ